MESGELAALVFLAKLYVAMTLTFPLLVWIVVGTPWFLVNFFIFLYDTLKGNVFKTFPKNLLEWNLLSFETLGELLFLKHYKNILGYGPVLKNTR